jgi:hypothetical protein
MALYFFSIRNGRYSGASGRGFGLKKIDTETKGVLAARIKKLADDGKLTPDIQEWAGHIRVLGNEAAHDEEPPTRQELSDLRSLPRW